MHFKQITFKGNDIEHTGVWTHAIGGADVTWFPPVITCSASNTVTHGGDALQFYIGCPRTYNGAYCDQDSSESRNFICEGFI